MRDRAHILREVETARRTAEEGMLHAATQLADRIAQVRENLIQHGTPGNLSDLRTWLEALEGWSHQDVVWSRISGLLDRMSS